MSMRSLSPKVNINKSYKKRQNYRPFSSIMPRTTFHSKNIKNLNDRKRIRYIIENNLYKEKNYNKICETKIKYNKLHKSDLMGKEKYTNFTIFAKREINYKDKNKNAKKMTRQHSALQLNNKRTFKDNPFYLTETIIKKNHKKVDYNIFNYNDNQNYKYNIYFPNSDLKDKNENIVIDNHKYKNIWILREIEHDKNFNKSSYDINFEKNYYLFNKKMEYLSLYKSKGKTTYNYMEDLNEYIKKKYGNVLKAEKAKITYEENKNIHESLDNRIYSLNKANNLYNQVFIYKYNDYIKFLDKQIDKDNKENYYLINEIFKLQKEVLKLKMKINKLLEDKKFFNKFIFLQICVQEKKLKLPEYYDYILNHTLEENINYFKGNLKVEEVKQIYDYKKNIIYKDFESYDYQIKIYENENRELLNNLDIVKRELNKLNLEKKLLLEEDQQLNDYLNEKMIEKSKERINIINKYNSLCNEKNKLLKQLKINHSNTSEIIDKTNEEKNNLTHYNSYYKKTRATTKGTLDNNSYSNSHINIRTKNRLNSTKIKSRAKHYINDEQLLLNYNIIYENPENKNHSHIYYKVRKLFILLKNFIKKEDNSKKNININNENVLILKMLEKIEDAMNKFIETDKNFNKKNRNQINNIKIILEKQRKILKGQKQMALIVAKYENMKKKIVDKNNKIYFLPNNRKRAISASINKRTKKKKESIFSKEQEFENFIEDFSED